MVVLAPITLDTTLADLYRQAKLGDVRKNIGQVFCGTSSALRLTPGLLRNAEFLYQDSSFNSTPPLELNAGNQTLQRSLALKYLSLVPQRDTFVCGDTAVIRFDIGEGEEEIQHVRVEAGKTLSVLDSNQRPRIVYSSGPSTSSWRRTHLSRAELLRSLSPSATAPEVLPPAQAIDALPLLNAIRARNVPFSIPLSLGPRHAVPPFSKKTRLGVYDNIPGVAARASSLRHLVRIGLYGFQVCAAKGIAELGLKGVDLSLERLCCVR
ncbi:hypothetical protein MMC31_004700 [Peltigera leucophlebia]|nr:hypothetical protein [Peltigera leucophlebia]